MRKTQPRGRALSPVEQARLVVVYRDPHALAPDPRNARTHSAEQLQQIRASMERFGNNVPILLRDDDTTIGAGHGRWEAALLDPPLAEVPTVTRHGLSEAEWRAYVIADNKIALNSGWDEDILAAEVAAILEDGEDLAGLLGFADAELAELLGPDEEVEPASGRGATFNYQEQFGVIVVCAGEAEQKQVFDQLTGQGLDCRVVVT